MTIRKRLFWSNLFMILVPAVVTALVGLLCVGVAWLTLLYGTDLGISDREDFERVCAVVSQMAEKRLAQGGSLEGLESFLTGNDMTLSVRTGGSDVYAHGSLGEDDLALLEAAQQLGGDVTVTRNGRSLGLAIAEIERDYLEIDHFQVEIAPDGVTGLRRGLSGEFSLILLDVMLPGMDGFAVCRRLREQLDIPVLMVTARREDIDKIRGLGLGADDYIEKPFSPSVLVARVKADLAQYRRLTGREKSTAEITLGDVRINTDTHRVYVKDREVELKNKEYELLLFLMLNADMVFDREPCTSASGVWTPWATTPP